ncbi:MAG: translocation/assembly module TamB domain-containing protein [Deltaproteobacteria bacterium]|nr:translocation/assembly module TamB domain-containing protein [Deltaproteobacteria bacterium]
MRKRLRSMLRAAARGSGSFVGLASVFALSAAGAVVIHASLPPSRRLVTRTALQALNQAISGQITVEGVDKLSMTSLVFRGVAISDPSGKVVIKSNQLEARVASYDLLSSWLWGSGDIRLRFPFARADEVVVDLQQDPSGELTLARTFQPRPRPPQPPGPPSARPPRHLVLDLPYIEIGSAYAQGNLSSLGAIDAEARTLHGSVHVGPDGVTIDTERCAVAIRKPVPLPTTGTAEFHLRSPGAVWGYFTGAVGEIDLSSFAMLDGRVIDVTVDVPAVKGETLTSFLPGTRFQQMVGGRFEAHGTLPDLHASARVAMGATSLDAQGPVHTSDKPTADLKVELRNFDLQTVLADAPHTQIGAGARVIVSGGPDGGPRATATGQLQPGTIANVPFPAADFDAVIEKKGVSGTSRIHEPGMPIDAGFSVTREGVVTVKASTTIASIDAAPRLAHAAKGRATVRLDAKVERGAIDAVLSADVDSVSKGPVKLRSGRLNAHAWGKPDGLTVDASLTGRGFAAGSLSWKDATFVARGPVRSPQVTVSLRDDAGPSIGTKASLSLGSQISAHNLRVEVGHGNEGFAVHAESVDIRDGTVDFGGIAIDGLGSPLDGVLKVGSNGFDVRLVSSGVNLEKLSRVLAIPGHQLAGTAAIDIDVRNSGSDSTGCARIDVRGGRFDMLSGIDASVRAKFSGAHVEFDSNLAVGADKSAPKVTGEGACLPAAAVATDALMTASAGGDVVLHGSPLRPQAWSDATGTARVTELKINLDQLAPLLMLARRAMPGVDIPSLKGTVRIQAEAARSKPKAPPAWAMSASTRGLELTSKAVSLQDKDVAVSATMTEAGMLSTLGCIGKAGSSGMDPACKPPDAAIAFTSNTNLNYERLLLVPSEWKERIAESQTSAHLRVHDRPISELLAPMLGDKESPVQTRHIGGDIFMVGTPRAPQFAMKAYVDRPSISGQSLPALMCLDGTYNGADGTASALLLRRPPGRGLAFDNLCKDASAPDGKQGAAASAPVGLVQGTFRAKWAEVIATRAGSKIPIDADATFKIDNLPLSDLGDGQSMGAISGYGGVAGLGRTPEVAVNLEVQGLRVGNGFNYDRGSLSLRSDAAGIRGGLELIDNTRIKDSGSPGKLNGEINSSDPVRFREGWIPELKDGQELKVSVTPSLFRISTLLPFVEPALSNLEGDLNGFVKATYVHNSDRSRVDEADLAVVNGSFQIPTVGQEFIDASAVIRTTTPGRLVVKDFRAAALSGSIAGAATIALDGLRLSRVMAALSTNEQNKIRLTAEGVPLGDLWGRVNADMTFKPERNDVQLTVSGIHVELSEADQRKVQALEANPDVKVVPGTGARTRGSGWTQTVASSTAPAKQAATPWQIKLVFADPAQIKRSGMRFSVTSVADEASRATIDYPNPSGSGMSMKGQVRLEDGRVDVVGKFFTIEPDRALVTFTGEAGNPDLNVTARWDAPDGTRVYADVTGTLKTPHLQLRSDPARPPSEILAMILFGGSSGTDVTRPDDTRTGGGSGAAAAGVGSGVAAAGINRLLADVAPMGISTRIDTSQRQNVRPTVVIEVARNVTAEATVNTGVVPLGQNPDRYLLTLDWRFLRAWSLRTTVGDAGSSILDVLWTHRY